AEQRRFSRSSNITLNNQPGSCWEEIILYFQHLWKHIHQNLIILWTNFKLKHTKGRNIKNSTTRQIQINSTENSSPLSNLNIIHRPNCPLYQSSSMNPYLITSPELSNVIDSINPQSSVINSPITPIISKTRPIKSINIAKIICSDVNTTPSAHNIVENLL